MGATTDEWLVSLLSSIGHSLAIIADNFKEKKCQDKKDDGSCCDCKYENTNSYDEPCCDCCYNHENKFEHK